ncbi:UDP-3-O-(3-hydroxymyristoyl)glucosamine N-acyltransferase [Deferribacter thermophilus]|uniref:UDP-3-O-(3-hydroxymyristoyl)glucosamine N-acyltransferase n=1 Tax=Deferribacter thermophilus TaxID=53573 RepID=UPI003C168255
MKLSEIAKKLNCDFNGEDVDILNVAAIDFPKPQSITFVGKEGYLRQLDSSKGFVAAILDEKLKGKDVNLPHLFVKDLKQAIKIVIDLFYPDEEIEHEISKTAVIGGVKIEKPVYIGDFTKIGDGTEIGCNTYIGDGVKIGNNVKIGKNCKIYSNVTIYSDVKIEDNVIIHSGTVIGSDGFGYVNTPSGHQKIKQVGSVIIESHVEIGANCTIDRGTLGDTIIGFGTKIDNLVQVGHNVKIGKHCIIVAQAGIAGSSEIGDFVIIGGQSGVADHVKIPAGTIIASRAGVPGNVKKPGVYSGSPIMDHKKWLKLNVILKNIDKYLKNLEGE